MALHVLGVSSAAFVTGDSAGNILAQGSVTGTTNVSVPDGGSVTVASGGADTMMQIQSVLGVAPGMTATFGSSAAAGTASGARIDVHVAFDAAGANGYDIQSGCAPTVQAAVAGDAVVNLGDSCNPADVTLLMIARDGSGTAVGATWIEHVSVADGAMQDVWVSDWSSGLATTTVTVAGVAGGSWVTGAATIWKNGHAYTPEGTISGPADLGFEAPVVFAAGADSMVVDLQVYNTDGLSGATFTRSITSPGATVPVDLSSDLLPPVIGAAFDLADPIHPHLSWAVAPGAIQPAAAVSTMIWSDAIGNSFQWSLLGASLDSMRSPTVPDALAGARSAQNFAPATVSLVQADGKSFADFAAAGSWNPKTDGTRRTSWRIVFPAQD